MRLEFFFMRETEKISWWNIWYWYPDFHGCVTTETKEANLTWSSISVGNSNVSKSKTLVALILTGRAWIRRYPRAGGTGSRQQQQQQQVIGMWLWRPRCYIFPSLQQINRPMQPRALTRVSPHLFPSDSWILPSVFDWINMIWVLCRSN